MAKKTIAAVANLVLDEDGVLQDVDPIRATPGSIVAFVLVNGSLAEHTVEIGNFQVKETKTEATLFASHLQTVKLVAGEVQVVKRVLLEKKYFGSGGDLLPYTTYKYTVTVTNKDAGTTKPYDPDLDVPPADAP